MQGDSRFEYFKQPHVIAVTVLLLAVVGLAVFTGIKRINTMKHVASLGTYDACREFIDDEVLCRFADKDEQSSQTNYVITSTTTTDSATEISTLEVESPDRMKSVTYQGPKETEAFVIIDAASYVKDYSDGVWALYEDPDFAPSEPVADVYDFSSDTAAGTVEFRDHYVSQGTEPCGDLTCYKYRVTSDEDVSLDTYIWFDNTDFLLRRHLAIASASTTNNQFDYHPVTITPPSPTKTVTSEEMDAYLEQN